MSEHTEHPGTEPTLKPSRLWALAVKWGKRILIALVVLFLAVSLLLQVPAVQSYVAQRITSTLSRSMETTVTIERLNIFFLHRFILEGFYVEDLNPGDTAIYSQRLYAQLSLNPITYLRHGLVVDQIELDSAIINIRKAEGAYETNIQVLLGRLLRPDRPRAGQEKRPFRLEVGRLSLRQVQFLKDDREQGNLLSIYLQEGRFLFDEINLPKNYVHTRAVMLKGPRVRVEAYPEHMVPAPLDTLVEDEDWPEDEPPTGQPFYATIRTFRLVDGRFALHNWYNAPVKTTPDDELDYQHLEVFDIQIGIDRFSFCSDSLDFSGQLQRMALRDSSGFVLENLSAAQARVWNRGVDLYGLKLKTPHSTLGDTLTFRYSTYEAFKDFPNRVSMGIHFNDASVTLRDIMTFAPGLNQNTFFRLNRERKLYLNGLVRDRVNRLSGEDLLIALDDNSLILEGSFSTRDLTVRNSEVLNLGLTRLSTSMPTLRQLLPGFAPPANFDRLGRLNFSGRFDGYFSSFVAFGALNTALGRATMDMQMNFQRGRERARYSGGLNLIDFDLGSWAENPDLGLINFTSKVLNGEGLTLETVQADLSAQVQSFIFKGYNYQNASLTGKLSKNLFEGWFAIQDDNIDFDFSGSMDFTGAKPSFNFNANVNKLDLEPLNLSRKPLSLAGQIELNADGRSLADIQGDGEVRNLVVRNGPRGRTDIELIQFNSTLDAQGQKLFELHSENVLDATLAGAFDIEQIPAALMQSLERSYPGFFQRLGLKAPAKAIDPQQFSYVVEIHDSQTLLTLLDEKLGMLCDGRISGSFDNLADSLYLTFYFPNFEYGPIELGDVGGDIYLDSVNGGFSLTVSEPVLNQKLYFQPISVLGLLYEDTLNVLLNYESESVSPLDLGTINLDARLFLADSLNFGLEFAQSNLILLQRPWLIEAGNQIRFRKGYIETRDFYLTSGVKEARLDAVNQRGLRLGLRNLDFQLINEIWDYEPLDFSGRFDLMLEAENVFELTGLHLRGAADSLLINRDDWGAFSLEADALDLKSRLEGTLSLKRGDARLEADGVFNLAELPGRGRKAEIWQQARYFEINSKLAGLPLKVAEYWIGGSVSNTEGKVGGDIRIYGLPGDPHLDGKLLVRDGGTTVDFLNTRYTFKEAVVALNDRFLFDASNTIIRDRFNKEARVFGGITHQKLQNLAIDARLETLERFLALDTRKGDNDYFFGHALGEGRVLFSGPLDRVDIYVNANVGEGTRLVIPVSYGTTAPGLRFIEFVDKTQAENGEPVVSTGQSPSGVSLEMDLIITDKAQGEIVFDEQAGDIIKGRGRGNIRILMPRNGDFQMFGDYLIEEGEYLFTLYNLVNKNFTIRSGGLISWSGDPFGAQIRLEAEYKDLSTSLANFIQDYLAEAPPEVKNDASKSTAVELKMLLRGDLLQPTINFDIGFPQLIGAIKTLADTKLRIIRQDPNELNRQVFGLIVVGQFLPPSTSIQGSEIFYNTISEFISNQLSLLLTQLFSEFISDDSALSGINLDIAYNQYRTVNLGEGQDISGGDEFQVRLRQDFFNDRLVIQVGGNVDIGNSARATLGSSGTFVGNDLVVEYAINNERTLRLRVYQRLQPDIGGGSRLEVGTGLNYRREFDSFGEFLDSVYQALKGENKKKKKPG
jgi:hypothetical protein